MKFLIFIFLIFLLGVTALYIFQAKLIFFPVVLDKNYVFKFDTAFEEKFIYYGDPGDKQFIHGLLFKPKQPIGRILYFHGNGSALDSWGPTAEELAQKLKCEILILDYPGFGKSSGSLATSEKALFESAEAALKEFISVTDASLPLILYGRSLGTGVASYLASKYAVQALVLETPYVSVKAMATERYTIAPAFLVRYDLDNQKNIKDLTVPVLMIHGTEDSVIPYSQSQILHHNYPKIEFVTIEGGDHNNLYEYPQYWEAVENFTKRII